MVTIQIIITEQRTEQWGTPETSRDLCIEEADRLEEAKVVDGTRKISPSYNKTDFCMNGQRMWQHTQGLPKFAPDKIPALKVRTSSSPTPWQEGTHNWYLLGKEKSIFSMGVLLAMSIALSLPPESLWMSLWLAGDFTLECKEISTCLTMEKGLTKCI